jgi:hypothetical protein
MCGSCVAFAAVATAEAQFRIETDNPSWNLDLSEQQLFSCGGARCDYGWWISNALDRMRDYGTPDETCFPYRAQDRPCSEQCSDSATRVLKIHNWNWNWVGYRHPEYIEAALKNGPLVAAFDVYEDFFTYAGGVYRHTWGNRAGGHAVTIVGYDSIEKYWIVKNSWGPGWGENGYFRIGFGECGIEDYVASVSIGIRKPDLTVEDVWIEKESQPGQPVKGGLQPGEPFYLWARVKNIGDATAVGFELYGSYDSYGRVWLIGSMAPGEASSWYRGPFTAESGTHTVKWEIDSGNKIEELDETNNAKEYQFTASGSLQAVDHVVINEVELDPPGDDTGNQWVELYNPTPTTVDLRGWTIQTISGQTEAIPLGTLVDPQGYYVMMYPGQWLSHNDRLILRDKDGREQHKTPECGWIRDSDKRTWGELTDSANDYYTWQRYPRPGSGIPDWAYAPSTRNTTNVPELTSAALTAVTVLLAGILILRRRKLTKRAL